jgi:hypothetical protein
MYSYIVRRLAFGVVAVVGVSIVVFVVLRILPGDPLVAIFGAEGFTRISEAERARYMADLGLSDPLPVQYLHWVQDILRGHLGHSFFRHESVAEMVLRRGPKSMAGIRTYLESLNARSEIKCINLTLTNQGTVNLYRPFSIEIDHVVGAVSDQSPKRRCVTYQAIAVIDTNPGRSSIDSLIARERHGESCPGSAG